MKIRIKTTCESSFPQLVRNENGKVSVKTDNRRHFAEGEEVSDLPDEWATQLVEMDLAEKVK